MRAFTQCVIVAIATLVTVPSAQAEGIPGPYRDCVKRGLNWLVAQQKGDGSWSSNGQYPITMTGLGGMSLLLEGSTVREGKYRDNIKRAVSFLVSRAQPNGMLGNPRIPGEAGRYMYGHGFALLFLASAYGEEQDVERRKELEEILEKAAVFSFQAQTSRGGWGYVSAKDGSDFDEGSVTITQVQSLRAVRNAGVKVPAQAIERAQKYLEKSTGSDGGVIYSLAQGGRGTGRPALTAAAISCGFSAGEYDSPQVKKWFKFCRDKIQGLGGGVRFGHDEYTHYYFAQALYILGDKGWKKMFPTDKDSDSLGWTKYRKETFERLKSSQQKQGDDQGYWRGAHVGPVFTTSMYLTILQLDNAALPIYQR